jgi:hypothetical protein
LTLICVETVHDPRQMRQHGDDVGRLCIAGHVVVVVTVAVYDVRIRTEAVWVGRTTLIVGLQRRCEHRGHVGEQLTILVGFRSRR